MTKLEILDRIEAKEKEKIKLLAELQVWFEAEAQGIDIKTVSSFGFDSNLVSQQERKVNGNLIATPKIFNYVRTKTGEKIPLVKPIKNPRAE